MLGLKKTFHAAVDNLVRRLTKKNGFPEKGIGSYPMQILLRLLALDITMHSPQYQFGKMIAPSDDVGALAWKLFIKQNPNQMGNWSTKTNQPDIFQKVEYETIRAFISLVHGKNDTLGGYITSGGTEGNIYSLWMGREYVRHKYPKQRPCVLMSDLTHHSIRKAARIADVPVLRVPMNPSTWAIDPAGLRIAIKKGCGNGYGVFLLPLTLGYTLTGTSDAYKEICTYLSKRPHIHVYCWIDAALNGMVMPFTTPFFTPFRHESIHSLVIDAHKFGGAPYPSGIVLYRNLLQRYIEQPIPYVPQTDATVLGSRPAASAIALWALIQAKGKNTYQKEIASYLQLKQYFIEKIQTMLPETEIVSGGDGLTCGVVFHSFPQQEIPRSVERTFGLWATTQTYHFVRKTKTLRVYKFHFLPPCSKKDVDLLCAQLISA
jgi:glutamate/tyrosine decarboxylase-like PLP-dependent enzyme